MHETNKTFHFFTFFWCGSRKKRGRLLEARSKCLAEKEIYDHEYFFCVAPIVAAKVIPHDIQEHFSPKTGQKDWMFSAILHPIVSDFRRLSY
jgi:hypothetical protein